MLNSIIQRHNKLTPLKNTEIKIVACATRLFLEKGYTETTHRMIAEETGIGLGTITYYYRTKEDLLLLLIEELMDFHLDVIEQSEEQTKDKLFSYATEIAIQIALCENNKKAWDLYHSAYNHPETMLFIKDWAAKKNFSLLAEFAPHLHESDFRNIENFTSGIELSALSSPCDRYFTLEEKIRLTLNLMMKAYDISAEERKQTIEKVLALDCEKIAVKMFEKFANKLDSTKEHNK